MVLIAATLQVRHQAYLVQLLPVANYSLAIYRLQICGIIRQAYMCALSDASCGTQRHRICCKFKAGLGSTAVCVQEAQSR